MDNTYHYVLKPWIDVKRLDWKSLSLNPNAIALLEENLDRVHWGNLSGNPAIHTLEMRC